MKNHLLQFILFSTLLSLIGFQQSGAQGSKSSRVNITITEGEKVTTDTSFELAEGQDPEMIKEIITHLAGDGSHTTHMSQEVYLSHSGDKKKVWVVSGDDAEHKQGHMMMGINVDSIKDAHPDARVLVIKEEDGELTVKEVDDEYEMHFPKGDRIEHQEMVFVTVGEDGENVHIHKSKSGRNIMMITDKEGDIEKEHTVIIHTEDDCDGKEKRIEVTVHTDDDVDVDVEKAQKEKKKTKKK